MANSTRRKRKALEGKANLLKTVTAWQELLDPDKKAASIKKLEAAIVALETGEEERIEGIEDIPDALEAYRDADKEDKEDAWEDIVAVVEDLSVLEEEESPPASKPLQPLPKHDRYIRCPLCARMARLAVFTEGPFKTWARDQAYGGRGMMEWGPREPLSGVEQTVIRRSAGEIKF